MVFVIEEKVVYRGHGVASIKGVIEKNIGGNLCKFYELTFMNKVATVLVPMVCDMEIMSIRSLSSVEIIDSALAIIAQPMKRIIHQEFSAGNWNKRNKLYQLKLRRGELLELSEIYRDLRFVGTQKELSFGEKKLLSKTEALLVEEIALVKKSDEQKMIECLRLLSNQKINLKELSQKEE